MPDEVKTEPAKGTPFQISTPKWLGGEEICDARLWADPLGANFLPHKEEGYENSVCPFSMQPCVHGQRRECPKPPKETEKKPEEKPTIIQLPIKKEEKIAA